MTVRINAAAVAQALEAAGHTAAEWDPDIADWTAAGYRVAGGGRRLVFLFYDGYGDEDAVLEAYRRALQRAGYQVTETPHHGGPGRRRLEVTRA